MSNKVYDALNNADAAEAAQGSMGVISTLQNLRTPGVQAAALAAAFVLMCERYGLRPTDTFVAAGNLMSDLDGRKPEFRAVEMYMQEELK